MKLLLGQLPSASLLARYDLPHYGAVASAVRLGDVAALNAALDAEQARFIRAGTYLLLEKLKAGVYRTLFKRVHVVQKARDPAKAFQVPIALFQAALAWRGVDMDADECEVRRRWRALAPVPGLTRACCAAVRARQPHLSQVHQGACGAAGDGALALR